MRDKQSIIEFYSQVCTFPHLCKSCGMCVGVCPTTAVGLKLNAFSQFIPDYDPEKCIACGKCIESCPGIDISDFKSTNLGGHLQLLLSHSKSPDFREKGSSGGVVTTLLDWGLKTGRFGKVLTLENVQYSVVPGPVIITASAQLSSTAGSKYVQYPLCAIAKQIDSNTVITTLPCQSLALKMANIKPKLIFGLFCSKAYTSDLVRYIAKQEKISVSDIQHVDYRHGNWPGHVHIQTHSREIKIPLIRSYFAAASNSYCFSIQGCLFCPDYFNDFSDISFGDPWGANQSEEILKGETVVIVRTSQGEIFIKDALAAGVITAEPLAEKTILVGHYTGKKFKQDDLATRLQLLTELGQPIPKSNQEATGTQGKIDQFIQSYYIRNSIQKKADYEKVINQSKVGMFVSRYAIHFLQFILRKVRKKNRES